MQTPNERRSQRRQEQPKRFLRNRNRNRANEEQMIRKLILASIFVTFLFLVILFLIVKVTNKFSTVAEVIKLQPMVLSETMQPESLSMERAVKAEGLVVSELKCSYEVDSKPTYEFRVNFTSRKALAPETVAETTEEPTPETAAETAEEPVPETAAEVTKEPTPETTAETAKEPEPENTAETDTIEEPKDENDTWMDYTYDDVTYLGNVIYREVGGYLRTLPYEEAIKSFELTGSVVLHRLEVNYRGATTLWEVINTPGQYGCQNTVNGGRIGPDECYEVAERLLRDGPIGPRNLLGQKPTKQGYKVYDEVDDHSKFGVMYWCLFKL